MTCMAEKSASRPSPPAARLRRLQLTMGVQCNVRCSMCFQTDYSPKLNMPAGIYRDLLRDTYGRIERLKVIGGEPTIMQNCREVAALVREHAALKLDIHTNGVLVDAFWQETFVEQGGMILFSINAATQRTYESIVRFGDYRRAIRNVERLLAGRKGRVPTVKLTSVILKENVSEIAELVRLGAALGVDSVVFGMDPILSRTCDRTRDEVRAELVRAKEAHAATGVAVQGLDRFERALCPAEAGDEAPLWATEAAVPCPVPFTELVVDSGGEVQVCCNSWVKLGSVYDSTLTELRGGELVAAFQRKVRSGDYLWCSPHCHKNPRPHPLALGHKLWTRVKEDPRQVVRKLARKVRQMRGPAGGRH